MPNSEELDAKILQQYTESEFPPGWKQKYVPEGCLDQLVTRQTIIREFARGAKLADGYHVDVYLEDLISFILGSAKKLMAICLLSGVGQGEPRQALEVFKSNQFDDNSLPLLSLDEHHPPWSQLDWTAVKLTNFNGIQWSFYAPIFSENNLKLDLENQHILPFQLASRELRSGAFSEVYEVTIHEAHLEVPMQKLTGGHATAAIKAIKPSATAVSKSEVDKEWGREEKALEETRGLRHAHIVEVKAIITWKGKGNYFMFQWADGGNLRDFYKKNPRPVLTKDLVKQIVQQLIGLADALDVLHNWKKNDREAGSYRHGDLKPENILRFENHSQVGFLRIADMGLAKHHFDETGLRGPTTTHYGTPLYEPPEAFTNPEDARSRQYDIWSMGCVILEIIIWLLYGNPELEAFNHTMNQTFRNNSPYWAWDERSKTVRVHPNVEACMRFIRKDPECKKSTAIRDLLTLVRTKLIVVPLPPSASSTGRQDNPARTSGQSSQSTEDPSGHFRAKASDFHDSLKKILEKGDSNNHYWVTGESRDGLTGPISKEAIPSVPMAAFSGDKIVPTITERAQAPEEGDIHDVS